VSGVDVLGHHGTALGRVGLGDQREFVVMAHLKGEMAENPDHDTHPQLILRARGQHAFSPDPEARDVAREYLDVWDLEPDDAAMVKLLTSWRAELYGARALYTSASADGGPARRWNG
jgi:hypothetical protein